MSRSSIPAFEVPLGTMLVPEQIVDAMTSTTVKQSIEELVERLAHLNLTDKKTAVTRRVMEREQLASTALGAGVAIPHARIDVGEKPVIAIGRNVAGVDFGAPDGAPVQLIFLVLWQPARPGLFNQLFANLVAHLSRESFRTELLAAKGAKAIRELCNSVRIDLMSSVETALDGKMLIKLQQIESVVRKGLEAKEAELIDRQIEMLRQDLDTSILWRYDRLRKLHGRAVVSAERGVCNGCYMQISSGIASGMLKNPTDLYICEKCGRFMVQQIT